MKHRWKQWFALALMALPVGCATGGSGDVASAVINTTLAVASSGISRSQGDCYASCPTGTQCDHNTGYCVPLPCRGECKANEQCIEDGLRSRCIALGLPGNTITVQPPQEAKTEP